MTTKKAQFPFVEFVQVAPALCMAFKGVLPSDLWLKYNQEGGRYLMELDMHIAVSINEKIAEAHNKSKAGTGAGGLQRLTGDDASAVIKRRNERRAARKKQQEDLSDS